MNVIELREFEPRTVPINQIRAIDAERLWRQFGNAVRVEFPSPATQNQWRLTALGVVGHLPVSPSLQLALQPKVPLSNLFRMWQYAYKLPVHVLVGLARAHSVQGCYENLAAVLAQRVLDRVRRGLHCAYVPRHAVLPFVAGRVDVVRMAQDPARLAVPCEFELHTAETDDNALLTYTLGVIARSGMCSARVQPLVRRAFHAINAVAPTQKEFTARDCVSGGAGGDEGRNYHRLNQDYAALHALCRFFLEHNSPSHAPGEKLAPPFLVDMGALFELFVAEWLRTHLPAAYAIKTQENVALADMADAQFALRFRIDIVLYHRASGAALCVLDTKYKAASEPNNTDFNQVVTYALAKGCRDAVLVYPSTHTRPFRSHIQGIRVRALPFALDGDLERNGQQFLQALVRAN
jgi:5-methylcytosine-specific restriction enzyme subunit McrC